MAAVLHAEQSWVCPNCPAAARTVGQPNRFHACQALGGLSAPLVLEGVDCQVTLTEREDYIGTEDVRMVLGRPVAALNVVRADGSNDCVVYAPTAKAIGEN
jgi:hypothetical protein